LQEQGMDKEEISASGKPEPVVPDNPDAPDSKRSNSSTDSDTPSLLGGFGLQGFRDEPSKEDEEALEDETEGDEDLNESEVEGNEDEELEQDDEEHSDMETKFIGHYEDEDDEDAEAEEAFEPSAIPLRGIPTNNEIPKMRSRFVMSNQQIRDFIDPDNQKEFNENISKLNDMLQDAQKEYCLQNFKGSQPEVKEFQLKKSLLAKLVYLDELDLAGNFLQLTVG
jgi:hypothetical protein